jgi:hypothetical protein
MLAQFMGHLNILTTARYIFNYDPAHTNAVNAMARMIMLIVEKARAELLVKTGSVSVDERTGKVL